MKVHFICRGNSFRSIIAEAYAKSLGINNIQFYSSGTIAKNKDTPNIIKHPIVVKELEKRGLGSFIKTNWGERTTQTMLDNADLCVFMNEIVKEEATELGLSYEEYECLEIDDDDEGDNLNNLDRTFSSVVHETTPEIFNQVDKILEKYI